uniref:Clathrin/coatomer adaptor adaptin-like N-terminal domain-containing protein n=1 Tax=Oreochromis aureus TaxID=47969 RepID=A0A668T2D3_OREAU
MQYLTLYSYNDQGGEEAAVEAGQESTPTSLSTGAAFSCSMLESNKESFTLEAMKRILGLTAKGKRASKLFSAVVKNVASENIELKKLVYMYLMRYAEEKQDLALLFISKFQRTLRTQTSLLIRAAQRMVNGKWTDSYIALFYSPGVLKALYTTYHIHPITPIHTSTLSVLSAFF